MNLEGKNVQYQAVLERNNSWTGFSSSGNKVNSVTAPYVYNWFKVFCLGKALMGREGGLKMFARMEFTW